MFALLSSCILSTVVLIVHASYMSTHQLHHADNLLKLDGQEMLGSSGAAVAASANPYLPLVAPKDLNFLLRNGMPRMAMVPPPQQLPQPQASIHIPSHISSGGVGRYPNRNDAGSSAVLMNPSVVFNQQPQLPQSMPRPAHAVYQPPPPNFKNAQNQAPSLPQPPSPQAQIVSVENANVVDFDSDQQQSMGQNGEQWPSPSTSDLPKITYLDVKCDKNFMKVSIHFDKPFMGVIFSKGHYNYRNCIYLMPNSGVKKLFFDVAINSCGTSGNAQGTFYNEDVSPDSGLFFENTIIIQYDPQVQEAWDQARKLRCTWHDQYEKAVSFRPFPVDMLDVVRADFAGDNVGCWMQIQVGKGPWASEVAGIVKIGQTMTMVLAIKDEENKFDMLVRNCIAHDGKRSPIELVDGNGCIVRPKLMTKFTKIKNFGSSASVLSYTHFQAFKFPDSMEVHFQCTIQICRFQCPDQCTKQPNADVINLYNHEESGERKRKRRDMQEMLISGTLTSSDSSSSGVEQIGDEKTIGVNRAIQVVSPRDLSFQLNPNNPEKMMLIDSQMSTTTATIEPTDNMICITTISFISALVSVALVCFACATIFLIFSRRDKLVHGKNGSTKHSNDNFATFLTYVK